MSNVVVNKKEADNLHEMLQDLGDEFLFYRNEMSENNSKTIQVSDECLEHTKKIYRLSTAKEPSQYTQAGVLNTHVLTEMGFMLAMLKDILWKDVLWYFESRDIHHVRRRLPASFGKMVEQLLITMTSDVSFMYDEA